MARIGRGAPLSSHFYRAPVGEDAPTMYRWDGDAWVDPGILKVWNGTAWVEKPLYVQET